MKKILCLVLLYTGFVGFAYSQSKSGYQIEGARTKSKSKRYTEKTDWIENVFIQPNIGFSFSSGSNYNVFGVYVSPTFGYSFFDFLGVGVGPSYYYESLKFDGGNKISANGIGGNAYLRVKVKDPFYAVMKYERLYINTSFSPDRVSADALFAGAMYMQSLSQKASMMLVVQYDLLFDTTVNQGSPISYEFGFVITPF